MSLVLNVTGIEIDGSIVELENLLQIRPVEKIFEHTTGGDGPGFVPAVTVGVVSGDLKIGWQGTGGWRAFLGSKQMGNVFFQLNLIVFGNPHGWSDLL